LREALGELDAPNGDDTGAITTDSMSTKRPQKQVQADRSAGWQEAARQDCHPRLRRSAQRDPKRRPAAAACPCQTASPTPCLAEASESTSAHAKGELASESVQTSTWTDLSVRANLRWGSRADDLRNLLDGLWSMQLHAFKKQFVLGWQPAWHKHPQSRKLPVSKKATASASSHQ
jgi:hypothetical protein